MAAESWSEYGQVVLQMAILDTLLSIEEKLDRLAGPAGEPSQAGPDRPIGEIRIVTVLRPATAHWKPEPYFRAP